MDPVSEGSESRVGDSVVDKCPLLAKFSAGCKKALLAHIRTGKFFECIRDFDSQDDSFFDLREGEVLLYEPEPPLAGRVVWPEDGTLSGYRIDPKRNVTPLKYGARKKFKQRDVVEWDIRKKKRLHLFPKYALRTVTKTPREGLRKEALEFREGRPYFVYIETGSRYYVQAENKTFGWISKKTGRKAIL